MEGLLIYIVVAAGISFLTTPLVKKIAILVNAISIPKDNRRIHKKPMPLLGGIAIFFAFIVTEILRKGPISKSEWGIIIGAAFIAIGGIIDDIVELKPWQKLIFQFIAVICLLVNNVKITVITNPLNQSDAYINIGWLAIPFTIIWVIGITNALNLIDGLDGLAAGVSFISCITIFIIAVLNGRDEAAVLTAILSGAILGFLPYNFNPASIFIGDSALVLGFLLSSISMESAIKSATAFAIAVPILAIGLPIYDTLFAMIRRKINGKPIMQGDRGHLHHKLLDMGLDQKQAVIVMYLISAILGGISIIAMQISSSRAYFLLAAVILAIVAIAWKIGIFAQIEK